LDILFVSDRESRKYNDFRRLLKECGQQRATLIQRRLDQLRAARQLEDLRNLPGHCHALTGDRKEQLAISLDGSYRLIFEAADEPVRRLPDGGLDWSRTSSIRIIEVVDYHD
jgi:plasmid maintenance system killer protein